MFSIPLNRLYRGAYSFFKGVYGNNGYDKSVFVSNEINLYSSVKIFYFLRPAISIKKLLNRLSWNLRLNIEIYIALTFKNCLNHENVTTMHVQFQLQLHSK